MKQNGFRWWILIVTTMTQMCAALSTQGIGVLVGFLQHDFALSNSKLGLLVSILSVAPIFGLFFIGRVLDCVGERLPVFLGMVTISLSLVLMSVAHQYWMLLIALFFCGIGYSPIQPGGSKAIYTWFLPKQRGFAMGIRQASLPLGGAIAAIIFPYIIYHSNWRYAVIFASVLVIMGGVVFLAIYRNLPSSITTTRNLSLHSIFKSFQQNNFTRITLIGMVLVAIQTFVLIFWMLFIHQHFHIILIKCAWYLFAVQISGALGRIMLATLGSVFKHGYHRTIFATLFILTMLLIIIAYLPSNSTHLTLAIISCLLGFFSFGWYGPWVIWLSNNSPSDNIGTTLGLSMALNQITIVITPLILGILLDTLGNYKVLWLGLAFITSIMVLKKFRINKHNFFVKHL